MGKELEWFPAVSQMAAGATSKCDLRATCGTGAAGTSFPPPCGTPAAALHGPGLPNLRGRHAAENSPG